MTRSGRPGSGAATVGGTAALLVALLAWTTPGAFGGYSASITNNADTAATASYFTCTDALGADRATALFQWPLNDTTGTGAADISGAGRNGVHVGGTVTDAGAPIACPRDPGTSWSLDGATQYAYSGAQQTPPNTFTIEVWFKTSTAQGRLIGFGSSTTGASLSYDRQLYISSAGLLVFGVYPNAFKTLSSATTVTDGAWHHAAATLSATTGMSLHLDGRLIGSDPSTTSGQAYLLTGGYWRVGYDSVANWPGAPASGWFKGRLRFAAVYTSALSAAQIARHRAAGL